MIKAKAIQASITLKAQASSKIARYKVTEKFKGKERFVESRQRKSSRVAPSRKASLKRGFRNQGKFKRSFKRYSKVAIERCGVLAPKKERKRIIVPLKCMAQFRTSLKVKLSKQSSSTHKIEFDALQRKERKPSCKISFCQVSPWSLQLLKKHGGRALCKY